MDVLPPSARNREQLEAWSNNTDYNNITFGISPEVSQMTLDGAIAEVSDAVINIEKMRQKGILHPVAEIPANRL